MSISKLLIHKLLERCSSKEEAFRELGDYDEKKKTIFIDRGGDVLGVAHLDVVECKDAKPPKLKHGRIHTVALDDRLGAWALLDLLPTLTNTPYDILLTTNEEKGESTARHWEPSEDKKYNWIFSFDRGGKDDCVTYEYTDVTWEKALKHAGFKTQYGNYSCIRELQHLDVCGVNFAIGYQRQHSAECNALLKITHKLVRDAARFLNMHSHIKFPHKPYSKPWKGEGHYRNRYGTNNYTGSNYTGSGYSGTSQNYGHQRPRQIGFQGNNNTSQYRAPEYGKQSGPRTLWCCKTFITAKWHYCPKCGNPVNRVHSDPFVFD